MVGAVVPSDTLASLTGEQALWLLAMAGRAVLLARLASQGIVSTYKYFTGWLAFDSLRSVVLWVFAGDPSTLTYAWVYVSTVPVLGVLQVLVILELYTLVLRNHPGIARFGRRSIAGALAVALLVATLTLFPDFSNPYQEHAFLLYAAIFERAVCSALLLALAAVTAFLVWFPVPLNRNTVVHSLVFAVFYLSGAILLLFRNLMGVEVIRILSTANVAITTCCYFTWCILLTKGGERRSVVFGHRWRLEDEERLMQQLNAVNETLLKSSRK